MTPSCRTTDRPDAGRISRGALVALVCIAALAVAGGVLARALKPPEEKTTEDGPRVLKPPVSAPAVEPTENKAGVPEGTGAVAQMQRGAAEMSFFCIMGLYKRQHGGYIAGGKYRK